MVCPLCPKDAVEARCYYVGTDSHGDLVCDFCFTPVCNQHVRYFRTTGTDIGHVFCRQCVANHTTDPTLDDSGTGEVPLAASHDGEPPGEQAQVQEPPTMDQQVLACYDEEEPETCASKAKAQQITWSDDDD